MCLAIPGKITEKNDDGMGVVDIMGVTQKASLELTPKAQVGDYVLLHAGFAIEVVDEKYANETLDLVREFPELVSDDFAFAQQTEEAGKRARTAAEGTN
jgi:hydrogenase expression/formation protein HypC